VRRCRRRRARTGTRRSFHDHLQLLAVEQQLLVRVLDASTSIAG
jgi:hypothetical protein